MQGTTLAFVFDFSRGRFAYLSHPTHKGLAALRDQLAVRGSAALYAALGQEVADRMNALWQQALMLFEGLHPNHRASSELDYVLPIQTPNGKVWLHITMAPLYMDAAGALVYAAGFASDITPYKTDEQIDGRLNHTGPDGQRRTQTLEAETEKRVHMSERQKDIMRLMLEGLSSKEISKRLGISVHTVNNHRTRLKAKTGCRNAVQLARYLLEKDSI